MYEGYAKHMGWTFEILDFAPANIGGLRHASARVSGHEAFRRLKFEGGTHRVQRIPQTGLSSRMQRIHTGTATVVVLPQPAEIDIKLDLRDLRIDTFRASGAGGQHVNCTESAIRVTHLPTGTVMECQEERSQLQNRQRALQKLQQCLFRIRYEAEAKSRQSSRKLQVGTRAQAERIRTYNFNQNRVTDHRILHTVHGIQSFVSGGRTLHDTIDLLLEASDWEALIDLQERNLGTRTAGSPSLED
uniref:Mitochondrial translational release factor 1 n=1 Tax=Eptatretus burgeri TaxID=7764 RepID=A0A8C4N4C6_EPTBU